MLLVLRSVRVPIGVCVRAPLAIDVVLVLAPESLVVHTSSFVRPPSSALLSPLSPQSLRAKVSDLEQELEHSLRGADTQQVGRRAERET